MKKVLLVLLITLTSQAQQVCPASVYSCELDYEGNVKAIGITEEAGDCFVSANRQCEKLINYTCSNEVSEVEETYENKIKVINKQLAALTKANKTLKLKLKRTQLKKK